MDRRQELAKLIDENLCHSPDTRRLRWILENNGWTNGADVAREATDSQIEAFFVVWGLDAYAC